VLGSEAAGRLPTDGREVVRAARGLRADPTIQPARRRRAASRRPAEAPLLREPARQTGSAATAGPRVPSERRFRPTQRLVLTWSGRRSASAMRPPVEGGVASALLDPSSPVFAGNRAFRM